MRAETEMAAGSGKSRHSSIPRAPRMPRLPTNTHDHAIVYSESRHSALSQPAFEQCPLLGCAPTGPLRPSIGAHMKRPSYLSLYLYGLIDYDRDRTDGMSADYSVVL